MREEKQTHTFKCGIKFCAHILVLDCEPRNFMNDAAKRGWHYVYTCEYTRKSNSPPWVCSDCWCQSGLEWR